MEENIVEVRVTVGGLVVKVVLVGVVTGVLEKVEVALVGTVEMKDVLRLIFQVVLGDVELEILTGLVVVREDVLIDVDSVEKEIEKTELEK